MAQEEWAAWAANRQSAVELLRIRLALSRAYRSDGEVRNVALPDALWDLIVESAHQGLYRGRGQRRPSLTHGDKLRQQAIYAFARTRKSELIATGLKATGANSAEDQAAEEARVLAHDRYGLNLSLATIKRRMQSSEK